MASQQDMLNSAYSWYAQQGVAPEAALELAIQAVQAAGMKESKKQPRSIEDIFQTDVGAIAGASTPGAYLAPEETFTEYSDEEIMSVSAPQYYDMYRYRQENKGKPNADTLAIKIFELVEQGMPYLEAERIIRNEVAGSSKDAVLGQQRYIELAAFAKNLYSQRDAFIAAKGAQTKGYNEALQSDAYTEAGLPRPTTKGGPSYGIPTYEPQLTLTGEKGRGLVGPTSSRLTGGTQGAVLPPELESFYQLVGGIAEEKFGKARKTIAPAVQERARLAAMGEMAGPPSPIDPKFLAGAQLTPQESQALILQENRKRKLYDELAKRVSPIIGARTPYTDAMKARLQVGP